MNALIFNHINLLVMLSTGIKVENIYFCGNSNAKRSTLALLKQYDVSYKIHWDITKFGQIKVFFRSLLLDRSIIIGDFRSKAGRLALLIGILQKFEIHFIDDGTNSFFGEGYDKFWSLFSPFSKFQFYSFLFGGGRNIIDISDKVFEMAGLLKLPVAKGKQRRVLVGCCYSERNYIDEEYYFDRIRWIFESFSVTHYKPHREVSPEKIARIGREFGLELLDKDVPIELLVNDGRTEATYSFGSTSDVSINLFSPTPIEQTVFELQTWRNKKQQKKYCFMIQKICEFSATDISFERI